ncbi:tetratricopeptide repeat protein [Cochlodiniinecator piscidefendens]|uniref:tetratricopeptide repeat protein n=1 Tax=Cochlodiniinecator piscidefendens TaxID=2715756 RepID=UPI00140808DE|nr:tetratricopeptide repeat protein [Cochlodiniinecator piscidefendens]
MRIFTSFALIVAPVVAHACPNVGERPDRYGEIYQELQTVENEAEARLLGNELWEFWAVAPDVQAQELLDLGMTRRAQFDFDGATESFSALIEYCPHFAEGYNQRAFVSFIQSDYVSALQDLERAIELAPDHIAAIAGQGLTLRQLGRTEAAQTALRRALALNPWLPERQYMTDPVEEEI